MSAANLYYVDLYNGRPANQAGQAATFPEVVAGGTISFALRFLEFYGTYTEKDQDIAALRVGLGPVDARPTAGHFSIKIGAGNTVVGSNATTPLAHNATAAQIAAALNALPQGANFVVSHERGSYVIRRSNGAATALSVVQNRLDPVSFGRIMSRVEGSEWTYELRLVVAPLAFSDSAARVLPDAPTITTLLDGGTDGSGGFRWNEIQQLHVPRNWRGTYQIRFGQFAKTELLDPFDGAVQIQRAINAMLKLQDGTVLGEVAVTNPQQDYANIEFKGDLGGTDVEQMQVLVFAAPDGDWTFDLPLDRYELFAALRDKEVLTLPFEAEADFYLDPDDHSAGTVTRKLWQTTLRVRRPQIMPDMAVTPGIDWLLINPQDYVPFAPGQIVTGPQIYSTVLGNGTSNSFSVAHGLDTTAIANILVRHNTAAWTALTEGVDYNATISNANSVQLDFATTPANNGLLVYVQAAPPVRQWEAHTHTIQQITGLQALLDNIIERIMNLEALLPQPGIAGSSVFSPPELFLPSFGEILPSLVAVRAGNEITVSSQLVKNEEKKNAPPTAPDGTAVAAAIEEQQMQEEATIKDPEHLPANVVCRLSIPAIGTTKNDGKDWEPSLFPAKRGNRLPVLLQAVSASQVYDTAALPLGTALLDGRVYRYTGSSEFYLPGDFGRRDQRVPTNGLFSYKQSAYYRVRNEGGNIYYPLEFERELWRAYVGVAQFPVGAKLRVEGQLRLALEGGAFDLGNRDFPPQVDWKAQYLLIAEAVELEDGLVSTAPLRTVLLGRTKIAATPAMESLRWRLELNNNGVQGIATNWTVYSQTQSADVFFRPAMIRLRLGGFDVDDARADGEPVRGQIALVMPPTQMEVTL